MRKGELVAGRFTIELLAGVGGTGTVYRAHDTERGGLVALKIARKTPESEDESEDNQSRLVREATVLSELHHPRIVGYVAHGVASTGEGAELGSSRRTPHRRSVQLPALAATLTFALI